MNPKVSIIVPVYNVEMYLRECLDSLVEQTYPNIEIIVVDDGAKDRSGEIADEYAERYENIITIHKNNEGLGLARNAGLKIATGDYVSFIDSDDYADKDMISNLMKPIIEQSFDTVIGGFKKVDDKKRILFVEKYSIQFFCNQDVFQVFFPRIIGSEPKQHDSFRMSVWNAVFDLNIIKSNNIVFPSERKFISEDLLFDFYYYQYAQKVCVLDSISYNYRTNTNSLTTKYRPEKFDMVTYLYQDMKKRIIEAYQGDENPIQRLQVQYLINIRSCIAQERRKISQKQYKEETRKIKEICSHPVVSDVVNAYPKNKLGFKQKIFVLLVKRKMTLLITALVEMGIM